MSSPKKGKKSDDSWSMSSKLMLLTTFLLLACFSVWSSFAKRSRLSQIEDLQKQVDLAKIQIVELQNLYERHNSETVFKFERLNARFTKMLDLLKTKTELMPVIENEFAVFQQNGPASGEKSVLLSAPKQGKHQLRIELWWQKEQIANEVHDIDAGAKYTIGFTAAENGIKITFPKKKPTQYIATGFDPAEVFSTGIRTRSRSPFVSINRPSWTKGLVFFSPIESGILHEFRFEEKAFSIDDAVTVRIVAESDGPRTAAADDMQTVSNLLQMLTRARKKEPFRFEDNRYIFE